MLLGFCLSRFGKTRAGKESIIGCVLDTAYYQSFAPVVKTRCGDWLAIVAVPMGYQPFSQSQRGREQGTEKISEIRAIRGGKIERIVKRWRPAVFASSARASRNQRPQGYPD